MQAGYCFHLFTRLKEASLAEYQVPEILRTPLEELCLQIKVRNCTILRVILFLFFTVVVFVVQSSFVVIANISCI